MSRVLVHETWGDHAALLARSQVSARGSVGVVVPQQLTLATPENPLLLEYGATLKHLTMMYETYGELNAKGDNAIIICHALTGSAHAAGVHDRDSADKSAGREVPGWWDPLIGPGKPIDTERFFVICSNVLGGCYGTTGPSSTNPDTDEPYRLSFPRYSIRDMVDAQKRLADALGVQRFAAVIGGSMGGMQVLEWAVRYPEMVLALSLLPLVHGILLGRLASMKWPEKPSPVTPFGTAATIPLGSSRKVVWVWLEPSPCSVTVRWIRWMPSLGANGSVPREICSG